MTHKTYQLTPITYWLFGCCFLVFAMIIVGAITRLTESGLSIAEWKPLMGAIPPLNDQEWQRVFDLYKQSPEFTKKNSWMQIDDFKNIFFWEWLHRLLGRLIGLAYGLPLLWFWLRKQIPQGYGLKLFGVFILGGLQGAMGWYMVKSGLVDIPAVSHFRLAAHLMLALLIYACMLWLGVSLRTQQIKNISTPKILKIHGLLALLILIATITWGAFTAGLDAGLIYNDSFPKMGGRWIPPEAYISILSNPAGVQFLHRWLAIGTFIMIISLWAHAYKRSALSPALNFAAIMVFIQAGLGIFTLFSGVSLPIAVLHQAGAVILLSLLLLSLKATYRVN